MPLNYLWKFHKQDDVHDFTSIECQHLKTDQSSFELQRMTVIMRASWLDRFSRVSMPASRRVLLFLSHIICSIKTKLVHRRRLATCHCYSFWLWTAYFILREVNKIVLWTEKNMLGWNLLLVFLHKTIIVYCKTALKRWITLRKRRVAETKRWFLCDRLIEWKACDWVWVEKHNQTR